MHNLAEKVDQCPLIGDVEYCLHTIGTVKLSVVRSSGVSTIQWLLKYWKDSRDFQNCPLYHECPLFRGAH